MKARILALLVFVLSLSVLVYASGKINETEKFAEVIETTLSGDISNAEGVKLSFGAHAGECLAWKCTSVRSRERQSFKHTKRSRTFFRLGLKMSLLHPSETMSGFRARSMY